MTKRYLGITTGLLVVSTLFLPLASCQEGPAVSGTQLAQYQTDLNVSGLRPVETCTQVKINCALPQSWRQLPATKGLFYTHQQWRSPSDLTMVGAVYVRMPLPFGTSALLHFAAREYARKQDNGRVLAQWTDSLNRSWFEIENNKYHVRGYALTHGLDAWIAYAGYKVTDPPIEPEVQLANQSLETILPTPLASER